MRKTTLAALALLLLAAAPVARAESVIPERVLGKANAPVTVDEFASLTCSHCAEFANVVLPEIEKRYVDTGKVKLVFHDFPLDGTALKAAALARCMPAAQFYPFLSVLYKNQEQWARNPSGPETVLIQYAKLGGLDGDKAKACLDDTKMQDTLVAGRTEAGQKYNIEATPTFIINNGEKILGARSLEEFSAALDRALAAAKK